MIFSLLSAISLQDVVVGGFDRDPPVIIAKGEEAQLAPVEAAAKKCGFPETWVWSSALWAHSYDVTADRVTCLRRWKASSNARVKWKLPGL